MSFYLYTCLSTRTHVFLPVHMSFYPYTCLSTCTRLSTCTHVFLPVHMSFYPYTCLSTRTHYSHSEPTSLCSYYLMLGTSRRSNTYLLFDPTQRAREKLHNWNGWLLRVDTILGLLYKLYFTRFSLILSSFYVNIILFNKYAFKKYTTQNGIREQVHRTLINSFLQLPSFNLLCTFILAIVSSTHNLNRC